VGAAVLDHFGLPRSDELLELAELGVSTLEAAAAHDSPGLLADFLRFAARRVEVLAGRSLPADALRNLPEALGHARSAGELAACQRLLDEALDVLADQGPTPPTHLGPTARAYLAHALAGRQDAAIAVVLDAAREGTDLAAILTEVLEPAQSEIGRLWEDGAISVPQEHYCTAVTQLAMSSLYPLLFERTARSAVRGRRARLVAAQAGGSLHEVGLRMVTDLLEHQGWDTTYLGAVTGPGPVVDALVHGAAEILALSASMAAQVSAAAVVIEAVRADARTAHVKVVVGGRPFLVAPELAAMIGADGVARDAREAVLLCTRLSRGGDVAV